MYVCTMCVTQSILLQIPLCIVVRHECQSEQFLGKTNMYTMYTSGFPLYLAEILEEAGNVLVANTVIHN